MFSTEESAVAVSFGVALFMAIFMVLLYIPVGYFVGSKYWQRNPYKSEQVQNRPALRDRFLWGTISVISAILWPISWPVFYCVLGKAPPRLPTLQHSSLPEQVRRRTRTWPDNHPQSSPRQTDASGVKKDFGRMWQSITRRFGNGKQRKPVLPMHNTPHASGH